MNGKSYKPFTVHRSPFTEIPMLEGVMGLHKKLDVWNASVQLASDIYELTRGFPSHEKFGLVSQMRRSAVSIASNIAEGAARQTRKEYVQFLYIATGSASELDTQIVISEKIWYVEHQSATEIQQSIKMVSRMLQGLIRKMRGKTMNCEP